MTRPIAAALVTLLLAACQGSPAPGGAAASTPPPPVAGASPGSGACVAPAIVVDAAGKATEVPAGGFAPGGSGLCVPGRDLGAGPADVVSVGGGYRVSLESPTGAPDATNPRQSLRATIRSASGGQAMVVDAAVRLVLYHVGMGAGHGFNPEGTAATQVADGYVLEPLAWPMTGLWLVTVKFKSPATPEDHAYFAVDVR